jgi:CBS domain-containing protein
MSATLKTIRSTARDLMTRGVETVDPGMSLAELASFFENREIHGALVRGSDSRPAGVVSVADIASVEALGGSTPTTAADRAGFYSQSWEATFDEYDLETIRIEESPLTVADVMTRQVVSVPADTPVAEIARSMLEQHIHRVLVHDGDEVVGIVTTSDLLALLAESREA